MTIKSFDVILKGIRDIGRTIKPINVTIPGGNINPHPLIIKLLSTGKMVLKKDYGFDEIFVIFDETDNNCYELNMYNHGTSNMIDRKNEMLDYLKIMEWNLIDMISTACRC